MKRMIILYCATALASASAAEWQSIFDGKTLKGWKGNPELWSVRDGAITGTTTAGKPLKFNTFLVWQDGELENFELKLKYRIERGNSGIQYRSELKDPEKFIVGGYQADFEAGKKYSGILYEEKGRGILALRGKQVKITAEGKKTAVGDVGDSDAIQAEIKHEDWNDYHILAKGNQLEHRINGLVTMKLTDHQEAKRAMKGILALQIHQGPPMVVQFKDLQLKTLPGKADGP